MKTGEHVELVSTVEIMEAFKHAGGIEAAPDSVSQFAHRFSIGDIGIVKKEEDDGSFVVQFAGGSVHCNDTIAKVINRAANG